jgi:hypothetical protein
MSGKQIDVYLEQLRQKRRERVRVRYPWRNKREQQTTRVETSVVSQAANDSVGNENRNLDDF